MASFISLSISRGRLDDAGRAGPRLQPKLIDDSAGTNRDDARRPGDVDLDLREQAIQLDRPDDTTERLRAERVSSPCRPAQALDLGDGDDAPVGASRSTVILPSRSQRRSVSTLIPSARAASAADSVFLGIAWQHADSGRGGRQVTHPADFLERAAPLLVDEARHNLILGIAGTLRDEPALYPEHELWLVEDGNAVVAAALRTPPYNLVLGGGSEAALAALAGETGSRIPAPWGQCPRSTTSSPPAPTRTATPEPRLPAITRRNGRAARCAAWAAA